ncbi:hypothetical protein ACIQMJ_32670 [Actinosynnema sp. NPDC091369]
MDYDLPALGDHEAEQIRSRFLKERFEDGLVPRQVLLVLKGLTDPGWWLRYGRVGMETVVAAVGKRLGAKYASLVGASEEIMDKIQDSRGSASIVKSHWKYYAEFNRSGSRGFPTVRVAVFAGDECTNEIGPTVLGGGVTEPFHEEVTQAIERLGFRLVMGKTWKKAGDGSGGWEVQVLRKRKR